jgi:hypothetical protein
MAAAVEVEKELIQDPQRDLLLYSLSSVTVRFLPLSLSPHFLAPPPLPVAARRECSFRHTALRIQISSHCPWPSL